MIEGVTKHVYDAFLVRLLAAFGEPASPEPERFLAEYSRMLRNYAASELSRAADHLLATHKGPHRWPRIADCIEAAEAAREAAQAQNRAERKALHGDRVEPSAASRERVRQLTDRTVQALRSKIPAERPAEIDMARTQRDGMREMMERSPNRWSLYTDHSLTRRITGERD